MRKKNYIVIILLLLLQSSFSQSPRSVINFNNDWKFFLGNDSNAINANYNDAKWRTLNLPHDWSIESDFIKDAPATNQGGSLPGGIGWYRKAFVLPATARDKNVQIEFDGVYQNSEVWINGHYLGKRPSGYANFSYELTEYLKPAPQKNSIVVKVDNSQQPNSRWYTGSGIYRDVKLVITNMFSFNDMFRTFVSAERDNNGQAIINTTAEMVSRNDGLFNSGKVKLEFFDMQGILISSKEKYFENTPTGNTNILFTDTLLKVKSWSVNTPNLYKAKLSLYKGIIKVDEITIPFGVRSFYFDSQKGFFLNNQPLKLHGVCMHHDLGALGAAFNKTAAKRQLLILKEMGCNAIRFSHNPPAAAMLDLCDEMGFLVIDEAFDMWRKKKNKFDYAKDFTEWHVKDLEAMIYRDRNHPSIIAWSIGNEIREQFDSTGTTITKELVDIVKAIDKSRPVISALTETFSEKNFITKANTLDILGFNYKDYDYDSLPVRFPNQKFIATETASALATRGVYQFPSDTMRIWPPNYKVQDTFSGNKDFTSAAYDNTYAYWGNTHEKSWLAVKKRAFMAGIFVWSGFDFLGEPMPYPKFPARSSYYGIVDLAGFPKDVYYMYQSEWSTKNVLHLFPHWNWNKGDTVDMWAYYNNADEVELFVNGKSVGIKKKRNDELHSMWRVPFEPGIVKAVSRKNGRTVLIKEIKTAGKPYRIELMADRKTIKADGKDLSFITARVVDKDGNMVPDADNLLKFSTTGTIKIIGTDNGYQADTVSLKKAERKAWKGMALAIIQSSQKKGNSTLTVTSTGLLPGTIALKTAD